MDLNEIRQRFLAKQTVSLDEERFFISSIRRGYAGALETRQASVRKAASAEAKRGAKKGLDDKALGNLLDSL